MSPSMTRLLLGAILLVAAGCRPDTTNIVCYDPDGNIVDASPDGAADGDADADADEEVDADDDSTMVCDPEAEEICNGFDDDCDGVIDEGFDLSTDPRHCGECLNACLLAHAFNDCVDGECVMTGCDACFHDLDGESDNGCEYGCCETATTEVPGSCEGDGADCCDGFDNDCDGDIDEDHDTSNDPNNCGGCAASCTSADCPFVCDYPFGVAECVDGTCHLVGCVEGRHDADGVESNGCEYACTPNPETGGAEICNARDDDCDGEVDDEFPGVGTACGSDVGACVAGALACERGREVCSGETPSTVETCNGLDDDCDGATDEDFALATDIRNCGACGHDCRALYEHAVLRCTAGSCDMIVCAPGFWDIDGAPGCEYACSYTGPESCNGLDDDCNGVVDDWTPAPGYCGLYGLCEGVDVECRDPDGGGPAPVQPVCDRPAGYEATEVTCDGLDNDCDGLVDEGFGVGLAYPCDNGGIGVCYGAGHYECNPAAPTGAPICAYDDPPLSARLEICNGLDDDCDGDVDENLSLSNMAAVHVLADVDLNDDGRIRGDEASWEYWMFQYEASHPDATMTELGTDWSYACSQPPDPLGFYDPDLDHAQGVLPWVAVSWRDAMDACCALNDMDDNAAIRGGCQYQTASVGTSNISVALGWSLCAAPDWEAACQSGDHLTDPLLAGAPWVYPYESDSYLAASCNGFDHDADPSSGGNQSFAVPSGSMSGCVGGAPVFGDDHADMSGNVSEWTSTGWYVCACDTTGACQAGCPCDRHCACPCDTDYGTPGSRCQAGCACDRDCNRYYEYRGGAYDGSSPGMTCQSDFNVGADRSDAPTGGGEPEPGLALESLGFRCCYYPAL